MYVYKLVFFILTSYLLCNYGTLVYCCYYIAIRNYIWDSGVLLQAVVTVLNRYMAVNVRSTFYIHNSQLAHTNRLQARLKPFTTIVKNWGRPVSMVYIISDNS